MHNNAKIQMQLMHLDALVFCVVGKSLEHYSLLPFRILQVYIYLQIYFRVHLAYYNSSLFPLTSLNILLVSSFFMSWTKSLKFFHFISTCNMFLTLRTWYYALCFITIKTCIMKIWNVWNLYLWFDNLLQEKLSNTDCLSMKQNYIN